MRPIDGDRLKAFLIDTEKALKGNKKDNQGAWDLYVYAIGKAFEITRNAIDRMPELWITEDEERGRRKQ